MYLDFFNLRERPFSITPDPRFLYLGRGHREVLAHLLFGVEQRCGFVAVTGEVGTGKTTLIRAFIDSLPGERFRTALIFNPRLSSLELLQAMGREFGLKVDGLDRGLLLDSLNTFLLAENGAGRTVVLIIDEAQNLEPKVLEEIRLLSNLETDRDKLIQILLVGQPELGPLLDEPSLRQLRQRITLYYHLGPLDRLEFPAYIAHRLNVAGLRESSTPPQFTPRAVRKLMRLSRGIPRQLNVLLDRCLLMAFTEETRTIDGRLVRRSARELSGPKRPLLSRRALALATLALVLVLGGALIWESGPQWSSLPEGSDKVIEQADPLLTEDDRQRLQTVLVGYTPGETLKNSFDALYRTWGHGELQVAATRLERSGPPGGLVSPFELTLYRGSLEGLRTLGLPALLEWQLPGETGIRYVALTEWDGEGAAILLPSGERQSWKLETLAYGWSGAAWLLWQNRLNIPWPMATGWEGDGLAALQQSLKSLGYYDGPLSQRFDAAMEQALRNYQHHRDLTPDGLLGPLTLISLHREMGAYPELNGEELRP